MAYEFVQLTSREWSACHYLIKNGPSSISDICRGCESVNHDQFSRIIKKLYEHQLITIERKGRCKIIRPTDKLRRIFSGPKQEASL